MIYLIANLFILLDFLTGITKALYKKEFTSSGMREGLFHKLGSLLAIACGALADYSQGFIDLGLTLPVAGAICTYIILMELGSIIENIGIINPNIVPKKIAQCFGKLEIKESEENTNEV